MAKSTATFSLDSDSIDWLRENKKENISGFVDTLIKREMGTEKEDGSFEYAKESWKKSFEKMALATMELVVRSDVCLNMIDVEVKRLESERERISDVKKNAIQELEKKRKLMEEALGPRMAELMEKARANPELISELADAYVIIGSNRRALFGTGELEVYVNEKLKEEDNNGPTNKQGD